MYLTAADADDVGDDGDVCDGFPGVSTTDNELFCGWVLN